MVLTLHAITRAASGLYSCNASNGVGPEARAHIKVSRVFLYSLHFPSKAPRSLPTARPSHPADCWGRSRISGAPYMCCSLIAHVGGEACICIGVCICIWICICISLYLSKVVWQKNSMSLDNVRLDMRRGYSSSREGRKHHLTVHRCDCLCHHPPCSGWGRRILRTTPALRPTALGRQKLTSSWEGTPHLRNSTAKSSTLGPIPTRSPG